MTPWLQVGFHQHNISSFEDPSLAKSELAMTNLVDTMNIGYSKMLLEPKDSDRFVLSWASLCEWRPQLVRFPYQGSQASEEASSGQAGSRQ